MKILLIGSGGREHAIALKLAESSRLSQLFIAPGNAGTASLGTNVAISDTDVNALLQFAQTNTIDLTIVGPEAPLVKGIVDQFKANGLAIIGPSKEAAQLEGSKAWAKAFMKDCGIPTASYDVFQDYDTAKSFIEANTQYPIVIKADGLAAGKGVTVATSQEMALQALSDCFIDNVFADAGQQVVIESFLQGEEASIFAFTDGKTIVPMVPAQDHKAIYDGDKGPNTGGMGAYSPTPIASEKIQEQVLETVFKPLLKGFQDRHIDYTGIVYAGLMIDGDTVNIVEFNVRFGDPETQVVLPRLETDLIDIFEAMTLGQLSTLDIQWNSHPTVTVVLASDGYPGSYEKGKVISGIDTCNQLSGCHVVHAGTKSDNQQLLSNGGRVLAVVAQKESLSKALETAYQGVACVSFENKYYRTDIGHKALKNR